MTNRFHQPVMADEAVEYLVTNPGGAYIDATSGGGGHTLRIADRLISSGKIVAIDLDPEAVEETKAKLAEASVEAKVIKGDFGHLKELAREAGMTSVDGILYDLGMSSHQIDFPQRGFSYRAEGPLDLRMDPDQPVTAADIVNSYSHDRLSRLLYDYGEEKNSRRIASAIIEARRKRHISTTAELARVISSITNPRYLNKTLSRVFQALRIEVNDEMNQLQSGLEQGFELLSSGGRQVVISYHSLEDRLVKYMMRDKTRPAGECPARLITRKPLTPRSEEITANPRARSAKMRVIEKV